MNLLLTKPVGIINKCGTCSTVCHGGAGLAAGPNTEGAGAAPAVPAVLPPTGRLAKSLSRSSVTTLLLHANTQHTMNSASTWHQVKCASMRHQSAAGSCTSGCCQPHGNYVAADWHLLLSSPAGPCVTSRLQATQQRCLAGTARIRLDACCLPASQLWWKQRCCRRLCCAPCCCCLLAGLCLAACCSWQRVARDRCEWAFCTPV